MDKVKRLRELISNVIREELSHISEAEHDDLVDRTSSKNDPADLKKAFIFFKKNFSPEGWDIIEKFARGSSSSGWNRGHLLIRLATACGAKISNTPGNKNDLKFGDLKSYQNKDLYKLFKTGDLTQDTNKTIKLNKRANEETTSSAGGDYSTPKAFSKPGQKGNKATQTAKSQNYKDAPNTHKNFKPLYETKKK